MRIQLLTVVLLVGSLLFVACKKEGCTNPTATNYNTEAEKDDGSCVFESQPKNPHVYTMVSSSGDTLLHGYVPYQDGHAYTGINEDNNRYCFKSLLISNEEPGVLSGFEIYLNQNNQPNMSTVSEDNNDGNKFSFKTLGMDGVMYAFSAGSISIENFIKRNELKTEGNYRVTATIIYDGTFVDMTEDYVTGTFTITFNN